jgi:hypothetical protein
LPENGFVVGSQKAAADSVRQIIDDYKDGWQYVWEDGKKIKNENFEVTKNFNAANKNTLTGANIQYSSYGVGVIVEVNLIDSQTAKEWEDQ